MCLVLHTPAAISPNRLGTSLSCAGGAYPRARYIPVVYILGLIADGAQRRIHTITDCIRLFKEKSSLTIIEVPIWHAGFFVFTQYFFISFFLFLFFLFLFLFFLLFHCMTLRPRQEPRCHKFFKLSCA